MTSGAIDMSASTPSVSVIGLLKIQYTEKLLRPRSRNMTAGSLAQLRFLWNRLSRHREPKHTYRVRCFLVYKVVSWLRYRWVLPASQAAGCQGISELKVDNCLIN